MAKTKNKKEQIYKEYKDFLGSYQTVIAFDTNAIKTKSIEELKQKLEATNARYILLKNTLFTKAIKEAYSDIEIQTIEGQTGGLFVNDDPSETLKVLSAFMNENKSVTIRFGVIDSTLYNGESIIEISKLPSKPEMIAKTIGTIKAPLFSFVHVLSGVQQQFVYTLKAIEQKKTS